MPVVIRIKGYSFFFFSNEGNPREPIHIHVRKGENIAKVWLVPEIKIAYAYGLNSNEMSLVLEVVRKNRKLIERKWYEFFGK